jgi:ribonuclease Z
MQIRKFGIKFQRINHILISHLHGDHFFGLVGFLSTMHLMGRDKGVTIYGPQELEGIVRTQLEVGGGKLNFDLVFISLNGNESKLIFEDNLVEIHAFPLKHRVPTNGFLIKEKLKERQLLNDAIKGSELKLKHLPRLKKGEDVIDENGNIFSFEEFTAAPKPSYSYAYCSDTTYWESIIPFIENATFLYHEATFIEKDLERAKATFHSTASQAAKIAAKAKVYKLLLGHLSARYDSTETHLSEAKVFFNNSIVVEDGEKYIISQ